MTLKEAIERYTSNAEYERIHGSLQGCLEFRQLAEWLKDYERLLEQEPCNTDTCKVAKAYMNEWDKPNNSDEISRQAVLDRIRESIETHHNQYTTDMLNMWGLFTQFIKEMPPVTPQPKMGKWIKSRDMYGNYHFTCPFCEHDIATAYDVTWKDNYCSNCGVKMQEVV